mgnify:CR=1 FL=1
MYQNSPGFYHAIPETTNENKEYSSRNSSAYNNTPLDQQNHNSKSQVYGDHTPLNFEPPNEFEHKNSLQSLVIEGVMD